MRDFTYSNARQNLAKLLDIAMKRGEVRIRRRDGTNFVIRPEEKKPAKSPLDVNGIEVKGIGMNDVLKAIKARRTPATSARR